MSQNGTKPVPALARLPMAMIHRRQDQPRETFDVEKLLELADSLRENGLLEPIVVRPCPEHKGTDYQIVAGERRFRAALANCWTEIDAIVRPDETNLSAYVLAVIENVNRADLDPVEEAKAYRHMLDAGLDLETIAARVGKPVLQVRWKVEMLAAREDVLHLVSRGQMTASMAWRLSRLSVNGQALALRAVNGRPMSAQEQMGIVEALLLQEQQPDMFPEARVSEEEVQAARQYRDAMARVGEALNRLVDLDESLLAKALATELDRQEEFLKLVVAQASQLLRTIQRARGARTAINNGKGGANGNETA